MVLLLPLGLLLLLAGGGAAAAGADFATPATVGGELAYNKEFMSGILQAFMTKGKGVNVTRLLEAFNPTPCLQRCLPTVNQLFGSFSTPQLVSPRDNKQDAVALCRQLESVEECAASSKCDSTLLDLAVKTYKFACIDKIEDLSESLSCAQQSFASSRAECETACITTGGAATSQLAAAVDPAALPVDVVGLCESSVCLLGCMQKSLNSACTSRGNSHSLFNAILATSTSSDDNTLSSVLSGLLPTDCRDALKTQPNLPERIAQLAAIGKDAMPASVGKPKAALPPSSTTVASTTTTTTTPATTTTSPMTTTSASPSNPLLWSPAPVEAPIEVDGEARTLQCYVLDWERRPVAAPPIDRLARLIAQQLVASGGIDGIQMRADDGDADSSDDLGPAFKRWAAAHDRENYRALGFGAPTRREGVAIPELRANSDDQPSTYPSVINLILAGVFPFVIYLMD